MENKRSQIQVSARSAFDTRWQRAAPTDWGSNAHSAGADDLRPSLRSSLEKGVDAVCRRNIRSVEHTENF